MAAARTRLQVAVQQPPQATRRNQVQGKLPQVVVEGLLVAARTWPHATAKLLQAVARKGLQTAAKRLRVVVPNGAAAARQSQAAEMHRWPWAAGLLAAGGAEPVAAGGEAPVGAVGDAPVLAGNQEPVAANAAVGNPVEPDGDGGSGSSSSDSSSSSSSDSSDSGSCELSVRCKLRMECCCVKPAGLTSHNVRDNDARCLWHMTDGVWKDKQSAL